MPLLPSTKNPFTVTEQFKKKLTERTGINYFERDSKMRSISDAVVDEFTSIRQDYIAAFRAGYLSTASGEDLSRVAEGYGVSRGRATRAFVDRAHSNLCFYTRIGTFGTINNNAEIVIPAGTIINSIPNGNELGATIKFRTVSDTILPADSGLAYVSAEAVDVGTTSNVGANILVRHAFSSYADFGNESLKVTNFYPVVNARDEDSDQLIRFKAANRYSSLMQINETAYKLESLDIPGVVDSRIVSGYFGIGTAAVILLGAENRVDTQMLDMYTSRIARVQAPGLSVTAIPAVKTTLDMIVNASWNKSIPEAQRLRLENQMRVAIREYFRFVSIGGFIDFSLLEARIKERLEIPVILRQPQNRNGIFRNVFVRKSYGEANTDDRQELLNGFYQLDEDEYPTLGSFTLRLVGASQ